MEKIELMISRKEREFLDAQKIPLSKVFDAAGLATGTYQALMKATGTPFACNTTPCASGGHRLRTRKGHCIQCDTAKIAYMLRWNSPGYLYLARSASLKACKVGFSIDPDARIQAINSVGYGGTSDWELAAQYSLGTNGGKTESYAHGELRDYRINARYVRNGVPINCYEVFDCTLEQATDGCEIAIHRERLDSLASRDGRYIDAAKAIRLAWDFIAHDDPTEFPVFPTPTSVWLNDGVDPTWVIQFRYEFTHAFQITPGGVCILVCALSGDPEWFLLR